MTVLVETSSKLLLWTAVRGWQSIASRQEEEPLSTEAVKGVSIVRSCYQAMTSEEIAVTCICGYLWIM
jgi:hypothetical protein